MSDLQRAGAFRKLELANAACPGYENGIASERRDAAKKLNSREDLEPMIAHDAFLEYARLMLTVRQRFSISVDCRATVNAASQGEDELPAGQLAALELVQHRF